VTEYNTFDYFLNLFAIAVVCWPIYHLSPSGIVRKGILISMGWLCLWSVAPRFLLFYIMYWGIVWGALFLQRKNISSTVLFVALLAFLLFPMVSWKLWSSAYLQWANFIPHYLLWNFARPIGEIDLVNSILFPIGISFTTFRALDLLIKTRVGILEKTPDFLNFLAYAFFPFVLAVGPICEFNEVESKLNQKDRVTKKDFATGFCYLMSGLIKVFILAYPLSNSGAVFTFFEHQATWIIWLELLKFTFYIYLNFAGFADLAVGFARIFGFQIKGNFNFPFLQTNIQNFWNNWHMSLSAFAQRNIYVPCGGYRKNRQYIALLATMLVIALWHGLSWTWLCFGFFHGIGLCVHRYIERKKKRKTKKSESILITGLKVCVTFSFVCFSFPLVALADDAIVPFYKNLLGL